MGQYYWMLWVAIESDTRPELRLGFHCNSRLYFFNFLDDVSSDLSSTMRLMLLDCICLFSSKNSLLYLLPEEEAQAFRMEEALRNVASPQDHRSFGLLTIINDDGKVVKRRGSKSYDRRCILIRGSPSPTKGSKTTTSPASSTNRSKSTTSSLKQD